MGADDDVVFSHFEKDDATIMELLDHFGPEHGSATFFQGGSGGPCRAALTLGMPALVLFRNSDHIDHIDKCVLDWMILESQSNSNICFYVTREQLVNKLGLPPDVRKPLAARPQQSFDDLELAEMAALEAENALNLELDEEGELGAEGDGMDVNDLELDAADLDLADLNLFSEDPTPAKGSGKAKSKVAPKRKSALKRTAGDGVQQTAAAKRKVCKARASSAVA